MYLLKIFVFCCIVCLFDDTYSRLKCILEAVLLSLMFFAVLVVKLVRKFVVVVSDASCVRKVVKVDLT